MAGSFSKKQYAAIAPKAFAMKLLNDLCLECSIWAIFFSSSLTVSIIALFLRQILSATLMREFFILFLAFVISCTPSTNRFSKSAFIWDGIREQVLAMYAYILEIIMLETTEAAWMKVYEDYNYFSITHPVRFATVLFAILWSWQHGFFLFCIKNLQNSSAK